MAFLSEFFSRFDDIKKSFPKAKYNGTMGYACRLDNGDFSLVEMHVLPQNDWDKRALAYAAAFYGNQLVKGQRWSNIEESHWHQHSRRRHSECSLETDS